MTAATNWIERDSMNVLQSSVIAPKRRTQFLPELNSQIDIATVRVRRLRERESEFVRPAIREYAEKRVPEYVRCVEALRKAIEPLAGMSVYLGRDAVALKLPTFDVASLSHADLTIKCGDAKPWTDVANSWGAMPPARACWLED
jgi:hypothetical protein